MRGSIDAITRLVASIDVPALTTLSMFIEKYTLPVYGIILLLSFNHLRKEGRLLKTVAAIALSILIVITLKGITQVPRPCVIDPSIYKGVCPSDPDYSFPSGHGVVAASFLPPFIGNPFFAVYLLLFLGVAFSRMYLGVHFLSDVIASFVIAFFSYDLVSRIASKQLDISKPLRKDSTLEMRRQMVHISFGLIILLILSLSLKIIGINGPIYVEFVLFLLSIGLLLAINYKDMYPFSLIFKKFERKGALPGYGAFWYIMGLLFSFVFISNVSFLSAVIVALAIGDGMATLVGSKGRIRLPHNKDKTLEGMTAFILSTAIFSFPFIGLTAIPLSILTGLVESLPPKFDDNFTIPISAILLYKTLAILY